MGEEKWNAGGGEQQHHQVLAAAASRPFMCAQPVLAIQTPAFMVGLGRNMPCGSSSNSAEAPLLLLFCTPPPRQHCPYSPIMDCQMSILVHATACCAHKYESLNARAVSKPILWLR